MSNENHHEERASSWYRYRRHPLVQREVLTPLLNVSQKDLDWSFAVPAVIEGNK